MLTLCQSGRADYAQPLTLPHLKCFAITPLTLILRYTGKKLGEVQIICRTLCGSEFLLVVFNAFFVGQMSKIGNNQ